MASVSALLLALLQIFTLSFACAPGGLLASDAELIQDPEFVFSVSPPVGWTYYPQLTTTLTGQSQITNYFPGQGLSLTDASNNAAADVTASMLEAFNEAGILAPGVEITVVYEPDMISNCYTGTAIAAGTKVGVMSGGAITEIGTVPSAGLTVTSCSPLTGLDLTEYVKEVRVIVRGYTTARYTWNRISSSMLGTLNFRYHALFRSPVVITR
uniref:Spondin domain-containing protein n=1 Tax=Syphacia muris TaxID=451379 RepID=A0A0N5A8F7_9BILA